MGPTKKKKHKRAQKSHAGLSESVFIVAAVPRLHVCRSPREELVLLSGFVSGILVDHVLVSPAAVWLLLPTDHAEEDDDEEEEQTARHGQTDDHFCKKQMMNQRRHNQSAFFLF